MKHSILVYCLTALLFIGASCKKTVQGDSLIGTWELRFSSSGMTAPVNYPPGNGNRLKFTSNGYERYINGQLTQSGAYSVLPDSTAETNVCLLVQPGEFGNRIIYDNNYNNPKEFFQQSGNDLTFIKGCFALDAGVKLVYERY